MTAFPATAAATVWHAAASASAMAAGLPVAAHAYWPACLGSALPEAATGSRCASGSPSPIMLPSPPTATRHTLEPREASYLVGLFPASAASPFAFQAAFILARSAGSSLSNSALLTQGTAASSFLAAAAARCFSASAADRFSGQDGER